MNRAWLQSAVTMLLPHHFVLFFLFETDALRVHKNGIFYKSYKSMAVLSLNEAVVL